MSAIIYDFPDQLEQITSNLLQGEKAYAVYDCKGVGTGFVGITNMRVIMRDRSIVGNKVSLISIPYRNIRSIAMLSNKSRFGKFVSSSSIGIDLGGTTKIADFRGDDKARKAHDIILWHVLNTK